ncbi:Interferon-induced transmembrane protein [Micromonospora pattaloongensis]|uniref:Interferon-induced transmembrane protein n=1 Tax=Micromonospora pattaloongensis TaxID=405436 RepID=A0A1H3Q3Y6_9ACTN|nr:CD225/dispanin family protein [Micromonospora pattaloongensis]SDZ08204.1 Interferon-induced transmembrane protein [Micromonospora pattaloongensis]
MYPQNPPEPGFGEHKNPHEQVPPPYVPQSGYAPQSGYPQAYGYPASSPGLKPDNYLAWSIVSTIMCCWPMGIPAIVFASRVDSAWIRGDYLGAHEASRKARGWTIASAVTGGVFILGYIAIIALSMVASS